jgi:nitrogen fixation protein NifX
MALRIGLATRLLPDGEPTHILRVLADSIGLPPTADKLATLKVRDLKTAASGLLGDYDTSLLKEVLSRLQGAAVPDLIPPPPVEPYQTGDMPQSIRVACASNNGELLDGHFGSCQRFLIYQVALDEVRLIAYREQSSEMTGHDKNATRAQSIADCQLLYTVSIGGPAAAKVVKQGIHPLKVPEGGQARILMTTLQKTLSQKAPPWLAKFFQQ